MPVAKDLNFLSGDVVRHLQKSGAYEIEFSIYAMVDYSGTDGLFWYFKFNGKLSVGFSF